MLLAYHGRTDKITRQSMGFFCRLGGEIKAHRTKYASGRFGSEVAFSTPTPPIAAKPPVESSECAKLLGYPSVSPAAVVSFANAR